MPMARRRGSVRIIGDDAERSDFSKTALSTLLVIMLRPQKRARPTDEAIARGDECLWTDDVRAHVVWDLVVATLAKESVLLSNNHIDHVAASAIVCALCSLAQTCSLARSAIRNAAIFVDALYGADVPPDHLWGRHIYDIDSIERRQTLCDNAALPSGCPRRCRTIDCPRHYKPLDYSKRSKLLGVRTRLHRRCDGHEHVTFERLPHYYTVIYVLFRGYLCSLLTPAYYRYFICEEEAFIDLSAPPDKHSTAHWRVRERANYTPYQPSDLHIDYVSVWCYAAGPD